MMNCLLSFNSLTRTRHFSSLSDPGSTVTGILADPADFRSVRISLEEQILERMDGAKVENDRRIADSLVKI